jgi:hypothetical protein
MKKQSLVWVGIGVIAISSLCEAALSLMKKEERWSNYTQSWETKWPTKVKPVEKKQSAPLTICSDKR